MKLLTISLLALSLSALGAYAQTDTGAVKINLGTADKFAALGGSGVTYVATGGPLADPIVKYLETTAAVAREAGVTVNVYPRQGDPADAILDVAEERGADLIVVGNKGMTGAKRFLLGSVPNKVSHHAPCSVLIIRTT